MSALATLPPDALLAHAQARGIALRAEDGRLRFQAPPGALDDELRSALAASRDALLGLVAAPAPDAPPLAPAPAETRDLPAFGQQRLWFLERLHPGTCAYHIPATFHLQGPLDREALRRAFESLLERHEALRATFAEGASGVRVHTAAPARFDLPFDDLAPLADANARAEAIRVEEARRPFDLARGPLLRARLLRLAEERHTLLVTTHHIASDGWSFGVMTRDLAACYAAAAGGHAPPLAPLPIQYPDYAAWQHAWLDGPALERDLAFWAERLRGPLPVVSLPLDRPRPPVQTFEGANRARRLAPATEEALRSLARAERTSLFMVLFAAFAALLQRYAGEDDIVVGTPIANRLRRETEDLIGFFVNTLALRVDLSGGPTFREAIARVREVALEAFAHQDAPFEKVAERLQPERSLQHAPFFQVMFVHQNAPVPPLALPGLAPAPVEFRGGTSKFDCTLFVEEADGLRCIVEYNTDLFEEATIDRLLAHYDRLLAAAVAEPDRPLAELDILDQRERQHLLALGTGARLAPATVAEIGLPLESLTLTSLLERQRGLTPDASAVTSEGTTWTYVELHAAADRVAAALRQRGIGREDIVPILVERSLEMMAGLLGILKAGAAYLPLDPEYPPARLAFMIDDAAARVILTQRHLAGRLPETAVPVLRLDAPEDFPAGASGAADVRPEDAAYVIYTSGSTGRPKGVVVEHRSVVNRLLWQREAFPLAPGEAVLQKTPYTFDVSVGELFWPLTAGGRLVMARPGGHRDPDYLVDVVAAERVVSCHFVPSMLRAFLAAVPPARLAACRDLRLVPASGEALTPDLVAAFYRAAAAAGLPDLRLHNLYGPTEATVEVTHWPCPPAGEGARPATVPIGRPLANVRCYVLDPGGHPCPEGVWGELCLAGVQTARGYLNRPELTSRAVRGGPVRPG
jgi:amino acid adenylation domain-containing protein